MKFKLGKSVHQQLKDQGFSDPDIISRDEIINHIKNLEGLFNQKMKGDLELYICTPYIAGLKDTSKDSSEETYAVYFRMPKDR